jgi:hypothetical protein
MSKLTLKRNLDIDNLVIGSKTIDIEILKNNLKI